MAKGYAIKVGGLKELQKKFENVPAKTIKQVDVLLNAASNEFVNRAVQDAPIDESFLRQGISAKKNGEMNYEVVSAAPYSAYMEFGTKRRVSVPADLKDFAMQFKSKGGGTGEGFFEAIFGWVKRKKIRFESAATYKTGAKAGKNKLLSIEQTAYIIYHYLLLNGVRPHPFFFKQREVVAKTIEKGLESVMKKAK